MSAVGDPHVSTVTRESFDLWRTGWLTFAPVPLALVELSKFLLVLSRATERCVGRIPRFRPFFVFLKKMIRWTSLLVLQFSHLDETNADVAADGVTSGPWGKAQADSSVASPTCSYELPAADLNFDISGDDRSRLVRQESGNRLSEKVVAEESARAWQGLVEQGKKEDTSSSE